MLRLSRPLLLAIAAGALLLALWWLVSSLIGGNRAKVEARLNKNQAAAAVESGKDAVETVGKAAEREAAGDALSRDNERTIRDAEGADTKVAPPANDAGLAALCRRAAYRDSPACLGRLRDRAADHR